LVATLAGVSAISSLIVCEETLPDIGEMGSLDRGSLAPTPKSIINKFALIRIYDNGSGMSEEVQSKLYEPGFSTKPKGKGTGLGLKISRHIIVDKHKGDLTFYSKKGEETEFAIKIPFQQK
jgi:signal transduction histidine kinase